jgi:hypothetical protein
VDSKVTRALKKLEEAETVTKETRQQVEQQSQFQQLVTTVQGHERTFAAATPDYPKALAHVRQVRESQLKLLYPAATPQQLSQVISREEIQGAQQALQSGQNPADVLYRYAQTLGYKPPEPAPAVVPAVPAPDKSAARSLGSGGGAGPTPADASEGDDPYPELTAALKERFGVARRR